MCFECLVIIHCKLSAINNNLILFFCRSIDKNTKFEKLKHNFISSF